MNKSVKTAIIVGAIAIFLLIVIPPIWAAATGWSGSNWGMMGPGMMGSFGMGWFMPIFMIIFWVLIIWAIVALIRGLSSSGNSAKQADSAVEILKKRYAQGEISKQEYEEKKKDLVG
jgi:putative membrane protein